MAPRKKALALVSAQSASKKKNVKTASSLANGEGLQKATTALKAAVTAGLRKPPKADNLLRSEAIKSNPHGVRIYNANLENSKAVIAGYLNVKDTQSLAQLLDREGK